MPERPAPDTPEWIRGRLSGVRGLLLDLDGVMLLKGALIPGAAEAIEELNRRGTPYQVVTNTSLLSRASLAEQGRRLGLAIPVERITSALSVSAAWAHRTYPGEPLFVITSADGRREFEGQRLLNPEEADEPGARAAAVIIGDSPDEITYPNLNRAFRLVRAGARLIGMHRNQWWLTPAGPTLDSGAFVTGLEFATEQQALILGKPSRAFFVEAATDLLREVPTGRRIGRSALAMVGDDVRTDVLAAQRAGLRGVLVLTGKHGLDDVARAATQRRRGGRPDVVAGSLADVVAALD
jgi:HAD superfamily hydrolase (TIGR01458 family)